MPCSPRTLRGDLSLRVMVAGYTGLIVFSLQKRFPNSPHAGEETEPRRAPCERTHGVGPAALGLEGGHCPAQPHTGLPWVSLAQRQLSADGRYVTAAWRCRARLAKAPSGTNTRTSPEVHIILAR